MFVQCSSETKRDMREQTFSETTRFEDKQTQKHTNNFQTTQNKLRICEWHTKLCGLISHLIGCHCR